MAGTFRVGRRFTVGSELSVGPVAVFSPKPNVFSLLGGFSISLNRARFVFAFVSLCRRASGLGSHFNPRGFARVHAVQFLDVAFCSGDLRVRFSVTTAWSLMGVSWLV